jgi:hypothetical protein
MDYKAKYLKYKNKYLSLQRELAGGEMIGGIVGVENKKIDNILEILLRDVDNKTRSNIILLQQEIEILRNQLKDTNYRADFCQKEQTYNIQELDQYQEQQNNLLKEMENIKQQISELIQKYMINQDQDLNQDTKQNTKQIPDQGKNKKLWNILNIGRFL